LLTLIVFKQAVDLLVELCLLPLSFRSLLLFAAPPQSMSYPAVP
jgi:hypothetical protein